MSFCRPHQDMITWHDSLCCEDSSAEDFSTVLSTLWNGDINYPSVIVYTSWYMISQLQQPEWKLFYTGTASALCSYPHVKLSIRDLSQTFNTAPIFQLSHYFRQKYLGIASCAVSLLNNIRVRVEHSLLQQLIFTKNRLQFMQSAGRTWIKLWGRVQH